MLLSITACLSWREKYTYLYSLYSTLKLEQPLPRIHNDINDPKWLREEIHHHAQNEIELENMFTVT